MSATERATELLVDRATQGLESNQQQELEELLPHAQDLDPESFELAAAAIELAMLRVEEPLPASLRTRLSAQARDFYQEQPAVAAISAARAQPTPAPAEAQKPAGGDVLSFPVEEEPPASDPTRWLGWVAAAAIAIAAVGLWPDAPAPPLNTEPVIAVSEPAELTALEKRDAMLAEASGGDLIRLPWTATEDPSAQGAAGEVIWSPSQQRGYMTFSGLAANDPTVEQYQLWIFDAQQDERFPIGGNVFNIAESATGEVVVEIQAGIEVVTPTLFAITVEKPGGVVVSSRERLPLLAKVETQVS